MKKYLLAVLVQEDDERQILLDLLSETNSELVVITDNPVDIINTFQTKHFDLILFPLSQLNNPIYKKELKTIFILKTMVVYFNQSMDNDKFFLKEYSQIISGYLNIKGSVQEAVLCLDTAMKFLEMKKQFSEVKHKLNESKQNIIHLNTNLEDLIKKNTELSIKAEVSLKTQERFLNNISHEIRTPLNGINGILYLLKQTELNNIQQEYVNHLETSSQYLINMVNDLLYYSWIECGNTALQNEEFNLKIALTKLLRVFTSRAHKKGIELILESSGKIPEYIVGDVDKLSQIMVNLVNNAIKFSEGGEIFIKISVDENDNKTDKELLLHFTVKDDGIGIDKGLLDKIFDAFTPGEEGKTKKFSGAGLGLALSKQLVTIMKGKIWCERDLAKGSVFHFIIPFETCFKEELNNNFDILKNKRVLIIDDSSGTRSLLKKILHHYELFAETAGSYNETFARLKQAEQSNFYYDVILLDLTLPDISGWTIAEHIKKDPYHKLSKIIIITGLTLEAEKHYYEKTEVNGFLKKPFTAEDIINAILNLFEKKSIPQPEEKRDEISEFISLNILLVEDEKINQIFAKKVLEKHGYTVSTAINGKEAVKAFTSCNIDKDSQKPQFDLILMDIQMPEMNGLEATKIIRSLEINDTHIPIFALTAFAMPDDKNQCLEVGMDYFFTKPVNVKLLLEKINEQAILINQVEQEKNNKYSSFNKEELLDFQDNDFSFIIEIIQAFNEVNLVYTDQIKQNFLANDIAALKKSTHTLKGVLKIFMAKKSIKICEEIERQCQSVNVSSETIDSLEKEMALLRAELLEFSKELTERYDNEKF